jgi:short-subunit dehydrogenase
VVDSESPHVVAPIRDIISSYDPSTSSPCFIFHRPTSTHNHLTHSSGLGPVLASSYARASASTIYLVSRTLSRLESTTSDLSAKYPKTKFIPLATDIADTASVEKLFSTIPNKIDILINNAGYLSAPANILTADLADYWTSFTINVWGTTLLTQKFLQHYTSFSPTGPAVVITVNTLAAHEVLVPNLSAYASSKSASARLNELWAQDVPESTARFISLHPGALRTEMGEKAGILDQLPVSDLELPADMAVWLGTNESQWLNGRMMFTTFDVEKVRAVGKRVEQDGGKGWEGFLRGKLVGNGAFSA